MPAAIASRTDTRPQRRAAQLDGAAVARHNAGDRANHGVGAAAELAGEAEDFALAQLQRDRTGEARRDQVAHRQNQRAEAIAARREHLFEPAAEQVLDQLVDVQRFDPHRLEAAAVAEDRDAVCDLEHFAQPVGDVDDRAPFARQVAHHQLDLLDLDVRQRRRRLVEDEDARIARQQPRDLDQLLLRHRQVAGGRHRIDMAQPDPFEERPDALGEPPVGPDRIALAAAETDVLGHRQRRRRCSVPA